MSAIRASMLAARVDQCVTEIHELAGSVLPGESLKCDHNAVALRVLVVDNHAGFRRLAQRLLIAGGYEVVGLAAGGVEAVHQAVLLRPDLVLLEARKTSFYRQVEPAGRSVRQATHHLAVAPSTTTDR